MLAGAIGLMAAFSVSPSAAQEPWPFTSFEAHRYDSLINMDRNVGPPCCVPHIVGNPGEVLVHISAAVDVPWSEDLDRVTVRAPDLTLTLPGGEPMTQIGYFERIGLFEVGTKNATVSRPRGWPDDDADLFLEQVWSVPEDATAATLTFGEFFSVEIDIPQETSTPITPGDTATFAITSMTVMDGFDTVDEVLDQSLSGTVHADNGQIIQVNFEITPQMMTGVGRENFWFVTRHFHLVGPDRLRTTPLGQLDDGERLTDDIQHTISGANTVGNTYSYTYYFLGGGQPGTYTLYFLSDPVAQGTL